MKRFILIFLVFLACSQGAEVESAEPINVVSDSSFSFINSDLVEDSEDFTNKKTIIVFWADY
jgi:ABC-type molybdate transport system substrate-binding protein